MGKLTIVGDESKTYYFDNSKNRQNLDGETINRIKDGFYRTMDGLHELLDLLGKTNMSTELKIAQQALKTMKKSNLEHLWMKF
jgi:hypothetical protein